VSATHPPIDLDALQDAIAHQPPIAAATETAANGSGHAAPGIQRKGVEVQVEPHATPPVPHLGAEAAANMTKLAEAAAQDIRQLGQLAFDAGKRVQEECEQMARDVEANGGTVALHLTGLSQLLAEVGVSNRETLRRLVGGLPPSMMAPADNGQVTEQPGGIENATQIAPLNKGRGVRIPAWLGG
jgi:hypothetical protein